MVASDRISAFDVIMPNPVPGKGIILTHMSAFWFEMLSFSPVKTHFICLASDAYADRLRAAGPLAAASPEIVDRSTVVRRARRIDMECVVRGYITGSAWTEYRQHGTINGRAVRAGMREAEQFSEPQFTPSTKAASGHDEPLSREEGIELVGAEIYETLESMSIDIYERAHEYAARKGMILADTKFEFGYIDDQIALIDEVLTPDSSRFWDAAEWQPGKSPPPFDKQFLRNWLLEQDWDRTPPAPVLPDEIIVRTRDRYLQAYERLTGKSLIL
jgi:phosphoribosylaminoimidazole-succinocarboxamide synthase